MKRFWRNEDGFVLVLSLLMIPIFLGFGLLIIDIGRGNNAQADLQAATDSLALAGARELDGGSTSVDRAKAAMDNFSNSVGLMTVGAASADLTYVDESGNAFEVTFLSEVPDSDDTAITTAWLNDPNNLPVVQGDAKYVHVRGAAGNLTTSFLNPASLLQETVPIGAVAVAKSISAVCNITPLYICNPFEGVSGGGYSGEGLQANFALGNLHGRLIQLHPKGPSTHAPGNFGFLQVESFNGSTSASANAIREIFAGRTNGTCYENGQVTTKPGAATAIRTGINTAFDMYDGPFNGYKPGHPNNYFEIYPAENVRKGYVPGNGANGACNSTPSDDHLGNNDGDVPDANGNLPDGVWGFPNDDSTSAPSPVATGAAAPGATIGSGNWDVQTYLDKNYGTGTFDANNIPASFANVGNSVAMTGPSRYDVYRWEIDNGHAALASPGGELGTPACGASKNPTPILPQVDPDRRTIHAAIIDCGAAGNGGGVNSYAVTAYAKIFLARTMLASNVSNFITLDDGTVFESKDSTIDVEIIDITGAGGNGALDTFVREEAVLIR